MEANEARLNITYGGQNADLADPVSFDAADGDIKTWAAEAIANGSVPGLAEDTDPDFTDFIVDRFASNAERDYNLIQLRPKTPFGARG